MYVAEKSFEKKGMKMDGAKIVIQGFGNVGSFAALFSHQRGAKIIAVSDVSGAIFNGDGLDIPALIEYVKTNKTIKGFPKTQSLTNDELLELECDGLFPCALENQIDTHNAEKIKAKIIVEGANGPITNAATKILHRRGIFIAPDVIANGGGVIGSYFEWVQDIMSFFWDEDDVNNRLKSIITKAFETGFKFQQEKNTDMRSAAMAVSIQRLEKAMLLRGLYPR